MRTEIPPEKMVEKMKSLIMEVLTEQGGAAIKVGDMQDEVMKRYTKWEEEQKS